MNEQQCQLSSTNITQNVDKTLMDYLKEVAGLECRLWMQGRLISSLSFKANRLGKQKEIKYPYKPELIDDDTMAGFALGGMVFGFILLVGLVVFAVTGKGTGLLDCLLDYALIGSPLLLLAGAGFVKSLVKWLYELPGYHREVAKCDQAVAKDNARVARENVLKAEIKRQISSVKEEQAKTKNALNAIYSLEIIHPSYRNLVAVSTFYDYFDKGICVSLSGRDGAYAFYEEALRFQRIETKLDVIISKLDEISENQRYIAELVREGNASLRRIEKQNDRMISQQSEIVENTALTEYNTRCSAESMAAIEAIEIYRVLC